MRRRGVGGGGGGGTAAFVSMEKNLGQLDNGSHAGFRAVNKLDSLGATELRYSRIERPLRKLTLISAVARAYLAGMRIKYTRHEHESQFT